MGITLTLSMDDTEQADESGEDVTQHFSASVSAFNPSCAFLPPSSVSLFTQPHKSVGSFVHGQKDALRFDRVSSVSRAC